MGLRGRAAQPTKLKILRGNPGKRAINKAEPPPLAGEIHQPADIATDPVAMETWNRIVPMLQEMGIAGQQDYLILADICRKNSRRVMAQAVLTAEGLILTGPQGGQRVHPAFEIVETCESQLRMLYSRVGLDPSGRSSLKVTTKPKESKYSEFKIGG